MRELKEKPICCGKEMIYTPNAQSMIHSAEADIQQWVCLECGGFVSLVEDQLDEEELENYKENYELSK